MTTTPGLFVEIGVLPPFFAYATLKHDSPSPLNLCLPSFVFFKIKIS
jgi:hypothetical protein